MSVRSLRLWLLNPANMLWRGTPPPRPLGREQRGGPRGCEGSGSRGPDLQGGEGIRGDNRPGWGCAQRPARRDCWCLRLGGRRESFRSCIRESCRPGRGAWPQNASILPWALCGRSVGPLARAVHAFIHSLLRSIHSHSFIWPHTLLRMLCSVASLLLALGSAELPKQTRERSPFLLRRGASRRLGTLLQRPLIKAAPFCCDPGPPQSSWRGEAL